MKKPKRHLKPKRQVARLKPKRQLVVRKEMVDLGEYVRRDQLGDLRDELEELVSGYTRRAEAMHQKIEEFLSENETHRSIRDIKRVLGLADAPQHASVMHERVSWAYFHVWIGRINDRLTEIEKRLK
jgi:hypothetical protein